MKDIVWGSGTIVGQPMRVVFMAIGVCGAAAIIGLSGLVTFVLNDVDQKAADYMTGASSRILKTDVTVAELPISLKTGDGQVIGLRIANPAGFSETPALHAPEINVEINATSSNRSVLYIDKLTINRPEILVEIANTQANLSRLIQSTKAAALAEVESGQQINFIISEILMEDGQVTLMADVLGNEAVRTPLPDSRITDIGADENGISETELINRLTAFIIKSAERATRRIDIAAVALDRDLPNPDLNLKTLLSE